MTRWYARMADIPGIGFPGSPGVDRSRLPEAQVRPLQEPGSPYLYWPTPDGHASSSSSPAHRRAFADTTVMDTNELVRWIFEGMELPGIASDYHHLLQAASGSCGRGGGRPPTGCGSWRRSPPWTSL